MSARRVIRPALLLLAGCATGPDADLRDELEAARERWARSGLASYDLVVEASCFGPCMGEAIVRVRNGERIAVVDPDTGERVEIAEMSDTPYGTVEDLFDMVEGALAGEPDRLEVEFDRELGYPTLIVIDQFRRGVDDEIGVIVRSLEATERPPVEGDLEERKAQWEGEGLEDYDFVMSIVCFCPAELGRPVEVSVRGGEVVGLVDRASGEPLPDNFRTFYPTIDELFALLEQAIAAGAEIVQVTYDPDLGYPREAFVDRSTMIADEEVRYRVSELAPAP